MSDRSAPETPHPWSTWLVKAILAAGAVLAVGQLSLAIPGLLFLTIVEDLGLARKLQPDSVWPLGILITFVGSAMIVPASLAVRHKRPDIVGWRHVGWTALVTVVGTFIFTVVVAR
jgi:hypothetical protein